MTTHDDEILIDDLEGFRVVDNQLRQRILHLARHPASVKEMAGSLGLPVTRLYYHVNMLEEAGLLKVADVRKSGAQLERVYQSRAGIIRPSPDFVKNVGDTRAAAHALAGVLFDITRLEVEAVLEAGLEDGEPFGLIARSVICLPAEAAAEYSDRIEALAEEIQAASRACEDDDALLYSFTYAFVPTEPAPSTESTHRGEPD